MSNAITSEIESIDVYSKNLAQWGVEVKDYLLDGTRCDFQDLLIEVSEDRARIIEQEIEPMATRMEVRNKRLDELGDALAYIADIESQFTDDSEYKDTKYSSDSLTQSAVNGLKIVGYNNATVGSKLGMTKAEADYYQQKVKSKLDSLNNAASDDMTRLQSLVDRRDEAYSTATSLMDAVGETRANTIKNMA